MSPWKIKYVAILIISLLALACGQGLRRSGGNSGSGASDGAGSGGGSGDSGGSGGGGDSDPGGGLGATISLSPTSGSRNTRVTITGTGFAAPVTVTIGGVTCLDPTVVSSTSLTCDTGAHDPGPATVVVTQGSQTATLTNGFTYRAFLYVGTEGETRIRQYEIQTDGSLTALSPATISFSAAPTYLTYGTRSRRLFALLGGLMIASLSIGTDGTLTHLSASPASSSITGQRFAVGADGTKVYQADASATPPDIRVFSVESDGAFSIAQLTGSGRQAGGAAITPDGTSVYFTLGDGVENMGGYQVGAAGTLTEQTSSPYTGIISPGEIAISSDSKFIFQGDVGFSNFRSYARDLVNGNLSLGTAFASASLANKTYATHPSKACLYVVDFTTNNGQVLQWDSSGTLSSVPTSDFGTNVSPRRIAFSPGGGFAYVANQTFGKIGIYSVSNTCLLTNISTPDTGSQPTSITSF